MSLARKLAILVCAALPLSAAPRTTVIQDTIYKADGNKFNGLATVSWTPFDASDTSKIGMQTLTIEIVDGVFYTQLVPNSDATPVSYYTVDYSSDGVIQFSETWSVPPSASTLRIRDVRVATITGSSTGTGGGIVSPPSTLPVTESNVTGLLTDLALRPTKGAAYGAGRTAMINDTGAIDTVVGNLGDCVRVDGTSGPCFDSSQIPAFVDGETPGGSVDGSNSIFTLANPPTPAASLSIYRNGVLQLAGTDFNLQTDGSIFFTTGSVPQPGDVLRASYRSGGASPSGIVVPPSGLSSGGGLTATLAQVLCSATGTSNTGTAEVSLGSCTIPASSLVAGDRLEIRFVFTHTGTTNGYSFLVRWGSATVVQRTASPLDGVVTGHGDTVISSSGTSLDMQSWGSVLSLSSVTGNANESLTAPIKIDFLAHMSASGTDNVGLQNYTVLRYPAH